MSPTCQPHAGLRRLKAEVLERRDVPAPAWRTLNSQPLGRRAVSEEPIHLLSRAGPDLFHHRRRPC